MEVQRTSFVHGAPHTPSSSGGWGEEASSEGTKVPFPQGRRPPHSPGLCRCLNSVLCLTSSP